MNLFYNFYSYSRTQDILILVSLGLLVIAAYSSCVYQRGIFDLMYTKFRTPIVALTIYFILCISHHVLIVCGHSKTPYSFQWPMLLKALTIVQRICEINVCFSYIVLINNYISVNSSCTNLLLSI